jgi:diguanylate cyclase (GGDEF)-like protein/PAS domain S-box-containing protein
MRLKNIINKYRVLYAEDDIQLMKNMLRMFDEIFYSIDIAQNGEEALNLYTNSLKNTPYDIIITDIIMPKMDGITLAKKIKEIDPNQTIVVISAHNESEILQELLHLHIVYYLYKPIQFEEFSKLLFTVDKEITQKKEHTKSTQLFEVYNSNVMAFQFNTQGNITYASEAFLKVSEYLENDIIGKPFHILHHPTIGETLQKDILEALQHNRSWIGEIKQITKNGDSFWVKAYIFANFDQKNSKVGYICICENIDEKKHIELLSNTDSLTNIYNRRYFDHLLPKLINQAKRKNEMLYFIMLDIDYFKQYNDFYGHSMGDKALQNVATTLKNALNRANDYCFRLGGEEFGIIFDSKSAQNALEFAHTLQQKIENLHIEHIKSNVSSYLTISMGLSCLDANTIKSCEQLYTDTDKLLYEAKQTGRNKIVSLN